MNSYSWFMTIAICLCMLTGPAAAVETIEEPARQTSVLGEFDVVVIGGGLSGVGAALGAARSGAKTAVIEQTGYLGGYMRGTAMGNVLAIDGWRPALSEGVLLDITKKVVDLKADLYPSLESALQQGRLIVTNHEIFPQAFQSLVDDAGAKIFYFSTYTDSIVKDGWIDAVIVQTHMGRYAVRGKVFIDCTGLATVAAESGSPVKRARALMGLHGWVTNIDKARFDEWAKTRPKEGSPELRKWLEEKLGEPITYFSSDGDAPDMNDYPWDDWWGRNSGLLGDAFRQAVDAGELPLFYRAGESGKIGFIEGLKLTEFEITGPMARPRTYIVGVDPTDIEELSEAHLRSSQLLFQYAAFFRKYIPGFENSQITRLGNTTLNRAGRSIDNAFDPASEDIATTVTHDDAICVLQRGQQRGEYEVPYHAMLADGIDNLLAVGKSSSGAIKFRTHMLAVIMGQAAGTAAAIAVEDNVPPAQIDIRKLQAKLRATGIGIPER